MGCSSRSAADEASVKPTYCLRLSKNVSGMVEPSRSPVGANRASLRGWSAEALFDPEDRLGGLEHGVRVEAHRFDPELDEVGGHVGIVRGRLTTETAVDAVAAATLDGEPDHLLDALVPLVVVEGDDARCRGRPPGQLGEIVRADREAVEQLGEPVDQDDVVGDLAHRVDLEPVLAPLEPSSAIRFRTRSASSTRRTNGSIRITFVRPIVSRTRFMARHSSANPSRVSRVCVTGRATEPEHRVLLVGLEVRPADQAGVLVGLEVRHPHHDRLWPERGRDRADPLREPLDEERSPSG